jgi:hypothetical protein
MDKAAATLLCLEAVERRYVELRKWDVGDKLAAQTAGSNQGPWHISMSPALSIALSDAYFDAIGLPKLSDKRRA